LQVVIVITTIYIASSVAATSRKLYTHCQLWVQMHSVTHQGTCNALVTNKYFKLVKCCAKHNTAQHNLTHILTWPNTNALCAASTSGDT